MAKKTLILRPNSICNQDEKLIYVPSDTTDENAHLLINEVVPDDAATEIGVPDTLLLSTYFTVPIDELRNIDPLEFRGVLRLRADTKTSIGVNLSIPDITSDNLVKITSTDYFVNSLNTYETITHKFVYNQETSSADEGLQHIKAALLASGGRIIMIGQHSEGSGDKNTYYTYITQFYLEVDYDDGTEDETPLLYIKQSNTWTPITGVVYEKVNGVWQIGTLDKLSGGDNIVIKEV